MICKFCNEREAMPCKVRQGWIICTNCFARHPSTVRYRTSEAGRASQARRTAKYQRTDIGRANMARRKKKYRDTDEFREFHRFEERSRIRGIRIRENRL